MKRADELRERYARIVRFVRAVKETAAKMNTEDTTLIALAFIFGLLFDFIEVNSHNAAATRSDLVNTRDKWDWKPGDP